jgi:hypothetical protein
MAKLLLVLRVAMQVHNRKEKKQKNKKNPSLSLGFKLSPKNPSFKTAMAKLLLTLKIAWQVKKKT